MIDSIESAYIHYVTSFVNSRNLRIGMCDKNTKSNAIPKQGSLFSRAYRPLAQQYFSAGPGGSSLHPVPGVIFHHHFWGGGGGPLPHPLLGGPLSVSTSGGSSSTSTFGGSSSTTTSSPLLPPLLGGSSSMSTSGGSHVTYPIVLLYTTIEHPSASWEKFILDPHYQSLTDWQTNMSENITFLHTMYAGGKDCDWTRNAKFYIQLCKLMEPKAIFLWRSPCSV